MELHEGRELSKTLQGLETLGFTLRDFLKVGEGPPAYHLVTDGEAVTVCSLAEILSAVRDLGRKGIEIQRYKGLGEMNAEELAETTMSPATRTLLKVRLGDAAEADHIFTVLAGKDVARRRKYIEEHALDVRNLDV